MFHTPQALYSYIQSLADGATYYSELESLESKGSVLLMAYQNFLTLSNNFKDQHLKMVDRFAIAKNFELIGLTS